MIGQREPLQFGALGIDVLLDAVDILLKFGSKALEALDFLIGLG